MDIKNDLFLKSKEKKNSSDYYKENSNDKEDKLISKLLLSNGIFGSKIPGKYDNLLNNNLSNRKNNIFPFPNCKIISSLFTNDKDLENQLIAKKTNINEITPLNNNYSSLKNKRTKKDNISSFNDSINIFNEKASNPLLINYKIYNLKESSIFLIKIYDKFIKYFPIFTNLSELEKYICYNPLIENNPNFKIISPDFCHQSFFIKNHIITIEQLEKLKEKYVKHLFTKKNIISPEDIFKYFFEEIKINLSCINVQVPYEDVLKNCSYLINNINEIIDEFLNEKMNKENIFVENNTNKKNDITLRSGITKMDDMKKYDLKNNKIKNNDSIYNINNKIHKSFTSNNTNSKCIEKNILDYKMANIELEEYHNNGNDDLSENNKENNIIKIDEKNTKGIFPCPYCSRIFTFHCGLGGHISKRHPKNQNK